MNWYIEVLKKYAVFEGRAHRTEYWMYFLITALIGIAFSVLNLDLVSLLYSLAVLIPGTAVAVRRLHDTGRSGWWLLILLIPLIGVIVLIVFLAQEGQTESNKYGPVPTPASAMSAVKETVPSSNSVASKETTTITEETKEEVVINEVPQSSGVLVEAHESLEEKN